MTCSGSQNPHRGLSLQKGEVKEHKTVTRISHRSRLFSECMNRAQLAQDYDSARLGRFARYIIGFQLALEPYQRVG